MMPDLGKYASAVLLSYAASIALFALIIGISWWQSRRTKAALREIEARRNDTHRNEEAR